MRGKEEIKREEGYKRKKLYPWLGKEMKKEGRGFGKRGEEEKRVGKRE